MPSRAPLSPTTPELNAMHPLSSQQVAMIGERQQHVNDFIDDPSRLLAIVGPCALTDNPERLAAEAATLAAMGALIRACGYKPRSDEKNWGGMETTPHEVGQAHRITTDLAGTYGNVAMEFGYQEHADRYEDRTTLAWLGARSANNLELLRAIANRRNLPLAIKNGEDGDIEATLKRVDLVTQIRGGVGGAAILLYRGGKNALNPHDWERQYQRAHELTDGRMIVDTAHWGMRAHTGGNGKSLDGQRRAADHVLELAQGGYAPAGIMIEASDTESVVDPNLPFHEALVVVQALRDIKADLYASIR